MLRRCGNISKAIFQTVYDRIIIFLSTLINSCFRLPVVYRKVSKTAVGRSPAMLMWLVYFKCFFLVAEFSCKVEIFEQGGLEPIIKLLSSTDCDVQVWREESDLRAKSNLL